MDDNTVDEAPQPEPRVGILVRLRIIARPEEEARGEASTVHCPVIRGSCSVDHCLRCSHFRSIGVDERGPVIHCRPPHSRGAPSTDLAQVLDSTASGELLSAEVICLDCELAASTAAELLRTRGAQSAPVVDDHGVLVGVVQATALQRACKDAEACRGYAFGSAAPEVEDAMTSPEVALSESASVAQAARLMATRGLDCVPVVSHDQQVVGVLTAMDLVRWLAARSGSSAA